MKVFEATVSVEYTLHIMAENEAEVEEISSGIDPGDCGDVENSVWCREILNPEGWEHNYPDNGNGKLTIADIILSQQEDEEATLEEIEKKKFDVEHQMKFPFWENMGDEDENSRDASI